ncbi:MULTISPECIES: hypothetical protein [unclassified Lysinibacillus]|uniref:hypothetical protein n=1 Tax=unclassified Lysinibacillus TaxID=2636778 RepID=UPI00381728F7
MSFIKLTHIEKCTFFVLVGPSGLGHTICGLGRKRSGQRHEIGHAGVFTARDGLSLRSFTCSL